MTKRWTITVLSSFLIMQLSGCIRCFKVPPGPCPIDNLLLSQSDLPTTIFTETGSRSATGAPARVGIEKIGTSFSSATQGGLNQAIYRFLDLDDAQREILEIIQYEFNTQTSAEWSDLTLGISLHANLYKAACKVVRSKFLFCRYVAQYDIYLMDFDADLIALNLKDFIGMIQLIDQKAVRCLEQGRLDMDSQ